MGIINIKRVLYLGEKKNLHTNRKMSKRYESRKEEKQTINKQQKLFKQTKNQVNITKEYHILTGKMLK